MKRIQKLISVCLVFCMLAVQLPVTAAAEETHTGWYNYENSFWESGSEDSVFASAAFSAPTTLSEASTESDTISVLTIAGTDALTTPEGEGWSFDAETATLTLDGFHYENSDGAYGIYCDGNLTIILKGENTIDTSVTEVNDGAGIWVDGTLTIQGDSDAYESLSVVAGNMHAAIYGMKVLVDSCDDLSVEGLNGIIGTVQLAITNSSVTGKTPEFEYYRELELCDPYAALKSETDMQITNSTVNAESGLVGLYSSNMEIADDSMVNVIASGYPINILGSAEITDSKVTAINPSNEKDLAAFVEYFDSSFSSFFALYVGRYPGDKLIVLNSEITAEALHCAIHSINITIGDGSIVTASGGLYGMYSISSTSIADSVLNASSSWTLEDYNNFVFKEQVSPPCAICVSDQEECMTISDSEITVPSGILGIVAWEFEIKNSCIDVRNCSCAIWSYCSADMISCSRIYLEGSEEIAKEAASLLPPFAVFVENGSITIIDCQNVSVQGPIFGFVANKEIIISNSDLSASGGLIAINSAEGLHITNSSVQADARFTEDDLIEWELSTDNARLAVGVQKGTITLVNSSLENGLIITEFEDGSTAITDGNANLATAVTITPIPTAPTEPPEITEPVVQIVANGSCGENAEWKLEDNGVLTISGYGPIDFTDSSKSPWYDNRLDITTVVIAEGITEIAASSFSMCENIANICIPESVTVIHDYAFSYCCSLGSISIPESVTFIGNSAFNRCDSLTSITIPANVRHIGEKAFEQCLQLKGIWVDENNEVYSSDECGVLFNKDKTELLQTSGGLPGYYIIPNGVEHIGDYAFLWCKRLTNISIPESVKSIGVDAFKQCWLLESITIPQNITEIGSDAFYGCDNLTGIWVSEDNPSFSCDEAGVLFSKGKTQLIHFPAMLGGKYCIPDGTQVIMEKAFLNNERLTSISIPASVEEIAYHAFASVSELSEIVFYGNPPAINARAFEWTNTTAYYPSTNDTWNEDVMQNYGGTITWVSYEPEEPTEPEPTEPESTEPEGPDILAEGTCGENLTWKLDVNGTLTISGTGAMTDYEEKGAPWYGYYDTIISVVVKEGATSIGRYAFYGCSSLNAVSIPNSVTSIGGYAFRDCTSLTTVTIPDSVSSVGDCAFVGCTSLTMVSFPDSVTSIGWATFDGCSSLTTVTIPNSVTSIGVAAFCDCSSLTTVTIPNGVTSIGGSAFAGCTSLTTISIPDSVTSIGESAFEGCTSLTTVTIPDGITSIGERTFYGCSSLTTVSIPGSVTSIEDYAFRGCSSLTTVSIPGSVTSIGNSAFDGCSSLTTISIPDSVTSIGGAVFYGCSSLTTVTIPDGVSSIRYHTFSDCSSLTTVSIPGSVTSIEDYAFRGCTSLTTISIPDSVTSIGAVAFSGCSSLTTVTIPDGVTSIGNSAFDGCSSLTTVTIPDGVTSIGRCTFSGCTSLITVTIPDSVTSIGGDAFSCCNSLTSISIPKNVNSIGACAFYNCTGLNRIYFVGNAPTIGSDAFYNVTATAYYPANNETWTQDVMQDYGGTITWVSYEHEEPTEPEPTEPESTEPEGSDILAEGTCGENLTWNLDENGVLTISGVGEMEDFGTGNAAPWSDYRSQITSVVIEEGVTSLGCYAFYNCTALERIDYNADEMSDLSLYNYTFYQAGSKGTGITVNIGDNVKRIPANLFHTHGSTYNPKIISVKFGTGSICKSIGNSAFQGCTTMTSITIPESVTSIGDSAFYECSNLPSISIPDGLVSISNYTFYSCSKIANITIPDGVISIGSCAFTCCTSLTSITIPESVTTIGEHAFDGSGLTSIVIPANVTNIGEMAFYSNGSLNEIVVDEENSNYSSDGYGVLFDKEKTTLIQAPGGIQGEYVIPDSVTSIGNYAFWACRNLTSITIPDGVIIIGDRAFRYCSGLTDITIPDGVTSISDGTFEDCSNLTNIIIPENVTSIGECSFWGCSSLTDITIPDSVTRIGESAFAYCSTLSKILFEEDAPTFGTNVFASVSATAYYPAGNDTWTEDVMQDYGGTITWVEKVNVEQSLQEIVNSSEDMSPDEIRASVQELPTEDLASEMAADESGTGVIADIAALEEAAGGSAKVEVEESLDISAEQVTVVGANLNEATPDEEITLVIKEADHVDENDIPEEYDRSNALCISMELTNVEELTVPVKITLPVPSNLDPELVVIVHYASDGTVKEIIDPQIHKDGDQYYADFVLTSFSDFIMTQSISESEPESKVTYSTVSLSLAGDIGINYYLELSDDILADAGSYMAFTVAGQTQTVPLSEAIAKTDENGVTTYRFSCKVAAKQMTDTVVSQMYTSSAPVGDARTYSVKAYCDAAIPIFSQYEAYASLVDLMEAMLNYGAYSQIQFDYYTGNLANADLEDTSLPELTAEDLAAYAHGAAGSEDGIRISSVSLLLESTTTIRFYFQLDGTKSIDEYTFYVDGTAAAPVQSGENEYYVDKENVAAKELDEMATVTVGGLTVRYCGLSYVRQVAVQYPEYYSESLVNVAKALYAYNQAANTYFSA